MKLMKLFIFLFILELSIQLNLRGDPGADPERIPGVNIHVQYNDNDPANTRRYDGERMSTLDRIREMELKFQGDKSHLEKVLAAQAAKLSEISQLAMTTYNLLEAVSSKRYNKPDFYFSK